MDLKTLWAREKARVAAELNDATKDCRRRCSVKEESGTAATGASRTKTAAATASPTVKPSPAPKKKSSGAINVSTTFVRDRDRVFQLLLETSITPSTKEAAPNFNGSNEFAMEYADRAVRRFFGGPQPSQQQPVASVVQNNSGLAASPTSRGPTGRNPSLHVSSMLSLHGQSSSTQVQSAQPSGQTAAFSTMTKTAQNLRKNGRKRAGTEFSSQALKPYGGDIFGTRGDYIDGMLYMSRMKRSYQAMYSGGDQQLRNADSNLPWGELARPEGRNVLKDGVLDAFAVAGGNTTASNGGKMAVSGDRRRRYGSSIVISATSEEDEGQGSILPIVQWKQRQRCSLTLSNWSFNPENARLMVHENVVEALIRLCKDGDETTRLHCVTAFMNLSHLCELRRIIVQQGAVKTVAEVVNDTEDKAIRTACAITLCNLCSLQGEEGLLVEDGAVSALTTLINEHEKVSHICRSALFNLTCVSRSYHKIESVLKAFITLTATRNGSNSTGYPGSTEEEYDDITAKALCNLSNLKRIRLRLMEEGIVSAIASLLHPNNPLIQDLLAQILLNLSRLPACRNEMVAKGCMGTLVALAGTSNAITTNCLIANTLWNLSKDSGNVVRMVSEGLLLLVMELYREVREIGDRDQEDIDVITSMAAKEEELLQVCAHTLYNVSCCEDVRAKSVERDAVNILSSLSRRSTGEDAKQMCTLALCNLLSVQKAAGDIVTAGAITALIQLSMAPAQSCERRNLFSKALHGLCDKASTRVAVTDAGVIPALLFLSGINETEAHGGEGADLIQNQSADVLSEIRARCTAAFACLAADAHTAAHVCNAAVVQCVTKILALEHSNVVIERFCCSCLSLLCRDEQCSLIMVEVGAIEMVLTTCVESHDLESKASCCHVLASVSCHPSCCTALMRTGVVSVLATLAKIKEDPVIQRCCAITLANLSVEPDIRKTLASAGIVAIVSVLSNSYSEDSQCDCAKVLCNLSCIRGNEAVLVKEGAVGVLMMISMVRAVSVSTKETCIRALLNLLNAETMKHMVNEGLVKILPVFAGLTSKEVSTIVTIIFSKLLNHPVGRNALCAEQQSLSALFQLMSYELAMGDVSHLDEQERSLASLHETLLSELVYYDNSRLISVHTGILNALHRISMYEKRYSNTIDGGLDHCAEKKLALVFFTLAKSEDTRMAIASSSSLATLLKFLELHSPKDDCASECALFAVATLCWLGWHDDTRRFLQISEIPCALTNMLQMRGTEDDDCNNKPTSYSPQTVKACVLTLSCLAHSTELLEMMLTENTMVYLNTILAAKSPGLNDDETMESSLSSDKEFVALICYLFRQLSHVTFFSSVMNQQPTPILELFCVLVQRVVASKDIDSSLDCAEALCSIVFAPSPDQQTVNSPTPGRVGSITQATTSRPAQVLVASGVLKAIGSLMCDEQLPETRWRCAASLWALASVPEYRRQLVELGVTSMLVKESYRAAQIASLNTLQCCAGALCNLTIVTEESNAARMVDEGAMPALIELAKLENDTIREYCTLALSNLSGPSPKVESGAVSALLNLSLDFMPSGSGMLNSSPTRRASQQRPAVLRRPPLVCGERHKQFAVLPEFEIEIATNRSLDEQKFEAELVVSTPPPPHLPPVSADFLGSSARLKAPGAELSDTKVVSDCSPSSPDGDNLVGSTGEPTDRVVKRDEVSVEIMQMRFFDKMDPEESLALMTEMEEREGEEDSSWTEDHHNESAGNQEQGPATAQTLVEPKPGPSKGDQKQGDMTRSTEHLYGNSLRKVGTGASGSTAGSNHMLSPLSRVVTRKANTLQAAQKFKDKAVRKLRKDGVNKLAMLNSQSSPCLTKMVNTKPGVVSEDSANNRDHTLGGMAAGHITTVLKSQSLLASLPPSTSTPALPTPVTGMNDNRTDRHATLLAAVSAAGLYDAAPPKWQEFHGAALFKQSKKPGAKGKRKDMETLFNANATAALAEPKSIDSLVPATTIEEFQVQAKKLGLWS